jgi:hypothetical protein
MGSYFLTINIRQINVKLVNYIKYIYLNNIWANPVISKLVKYENYRKIWRISNFLKNNSSNRKRVTI